MSETISPHERILRDLVRLSRCRKHCGFSTTPRVATTGIEVWHNGVRESHAVLIDASLVSDLQRQASVLDAIIAWSEAIHGFDHSHSYEIPTKGEDGSDLRIVFECCGFL